LRFLLCSGTCSSLRWCVKAEDDRRLHTTLFFSRCQLFQNELCDEHVKEFGFPSPETIVVIAMESEVRSLHIPPIINNTC
jgi:hypothetical protein